MSTYFPDRWVILKIRADGETFYKVLAGWYGGYCGSDTWQMNSGIVKWEELKDEYVFHGASGSQYICHKQCEDFTSLSRDIYLNFRKQLRDTYKGKMDRVKMSAFKRVKFND